MTITGIMLGAKRRQTLIQTVPTRGRLEEKQRVAARALTEMPDAGAIFSDADFGEIDRIIARTEREPEKRTALAEAGVEEVFG